jgi:hypothetical protein
VLEQEPAIDEVIGTGLVPLVNVHGPELELRADRRRSLERDRILGDVSGAPKSP